MSIITKPLEFLWPGARGALRCGLWSQLAISLVFAVACHATLFLNFYWSDWLTPTERAGSCAALFVIWIALGAVARRRFNEYERTLAVDANGAEFSQAQALYLQGAWFESECCLKALLKRNARDVDALVMLATLYRHTQRFDEARRTLAALEKLDGADFWRVEIDFEKEAIKEDERQAREEALENSGVAEAENAAPTNASRVEETRKAA